MVFLPLFQLRKHYFSSLPAGDLRCLQRADDLFTIIKVRHHTAAFCYSMNKLFECMYKGMFIPDNMSLRPPCAHIWMFPFCDQDRPISALGIWFRIVIILQLIHPLQIKTKRTLASINFKTVVIFSACRKTGRFQTSHCPQ